MEENPTGSKVKLNRTESLLLVPYKQHLAPLYEGLIKRGHTVSALVHHEHLNSYDFKKVRITPMKIVVGYPLVAYKYLKIGFQVPRYILKFSKKVSNVKPTAMIVFDIYHWYVFQAIHYKKKHANIKLFIYCETKRWPKRKISALIMRFFLHYARSQQELIDKFLVYTYEARDFLSEYVPYEKVKVLPAPVDTDIFKPSAGSGREGALKILFNARFDEYKNHDDLFEALHDLKANGRKFQLTLIGRVDGGRDRVRKLVSKYDIEEEITWLEPKEKVEMPHLYRSHDLLVLPSYNEAIGMVVPEAMACGVPTITSDTVGANVYVKHNETGLIFETGNISALKSALEKYFNHPQLLTNHGKAASQHIRERYSVETLTNELSGLLQN